MNKFSNLSDTDLEYAYNNQEKLEFNKEQIEQLEEEMKNRMKKQGNKIIKNNSLEKVLTKKYNGFTSYLTLGLVLAGYAFGLVSYFFYICNK